MSDRIADRIQKAKTPSALGGLAAEIVSVETVNLLEVAILKRRVKHLDIDNLAKNNYDYAVKLADSASNLEFEEIFKFYCLYEAVMALAMLGFENSLEYKEKLLSKNIELLKTYSDFREIKDKYF